MSKIKVTKKRLRLTDIKPTLNNPRVIKDEKFKQLKQSLIDFPEMMELNSIKVDENNEILAGNMRFRACQELGWVDVPCDVAVGYTEEQKKEYIIKDNVSSGEWNWDVLANEWDSSKLNQWGIMVWDYEQPDNVLNGFGDLPPVDITKPTVTDAGYVRFECIMLEEHKKAIVKAINEHKEKNNFDTIGEAFFDLLQATLNSK